MTEHLSKFVALTLLRMKHRTIRAQNSQLVEGNAMQHIAESCLELQTVEGARSGKQKRPHQYLL